MLRSSLRRLQQAAAAQPGRVGTVPGPAGLEEWLSHGSPTDMSSLNTNLEKRYGNIFSLPASCLGKDQVNVTHPHDIQKVMAAEGPYPTAIGAAIPAWYHWDKERALRDGLGAMIGVADGEWWKHLRNNLQKPIFNPKDALEHLPNMARVAEENIHLFPKHVQEKGPRASLSIYVIDIITAMAVGKPLGLSTEEGLPKGHKYAKFLELSVAVAENMMKVMLDPESAQQFAKDKHSCIPYLKFKLNAERIMDVMALMVEECIETLEAGPGAPGFEAASHSYVATLIRQGKLSRDEFASSVLNFINAGVDTSSGQFEWMLWYTATNPDIQEQLRQQTYEALGGERGKIMPLTTENYPKCVHLRRAFKETLRLRPALMGTTRVLPEDITVGEPPHTIKAGTDINVFTAGVRTDPAIWGQDATEYRPERWNRDDADPITKSTSESQRVYDSSLRGHPYMLMVFGKGPRMCIGSRLVDFEYHILMSQLLQRYEITLEEGESPTIGTDTTTFIIRPDRQPNYVFTPIA